MDGGMWMSDDDVTLSEREKIMVLERERLLKKGKRLKSMAGKSGWSLELSAKWTAYKEEIEVYNIERRFDGEEPEYLDKLCD